MPFRLSDNINGKGVCPEHWAMFSKALKRKSSFLKFKRELKDQYLTRVKIDRLLEVEEGLQTCF
ncbi:hypothetical protein GCM10007096_25000 [Pullulanibacillus pueri]|uniref:Uncharacterized protein n=1 Tax=Pullulanibacillus pueri TaxID=1437324 RepID=A0A8J2ZXE2_9BACL|nr:hypothetical protein GCM10007096_25000 [Pullulanibacillus pueri]